MLFNGAPPHVRTVESDRGVVQHYTNRLVLFYQSDIIFRGHWRGIRDVCTQRDCWCASPSGWLLDASVLAQRCEIQN